MNDSERARAAYRDYMKRTGLSLILTTDKDAEFYEQLFVKGFLEAIHQIAKEADIT